MSTKLYDETNPISIENYAQKLIGKTFNDVLNDYTKYESELLISEEKEEYAENHENKKRKGGLGDLIEECYFHYKCNNDSRPDFPDAGVELKVTPYKINKNKTLSAKERLIITMIDYFKVVEENFEDSHLWNKSQLILLIYYLYSKDIENRLDYKINYAKLFTPPKEDLEIIKNDFKIIVDKIKAGKAHELSEGDTMYLGAATKSASSSDRRGQPFSDIPAKPRAFSFKTSYMTYVLNNFIVPNKTTYEPIIKDASELKFNTFEEIIINKINSYAGKTDEELCKIFDREYNDNKAQWIDLAYRMLGIKSNKAEEFEKANITVKALRIESKDKIVESSPLPTFKFKELVEETWKESKLFNYLDQQKFLFVVYKKDGDKYVLKGAQLWNIPYGDLNTTVREGWENIRNVIIDGVKFTPKTDKNGKVIYSNNLPNKESNRVIHIRPHAQKSAYRFEDGTEIGNVSRNANELPDGRYMTNQSFWLNNTYVLSQLNKNLLD
ncbi:MAG: Sau3AI family type II restriction endonuclease [Clostridium perfringens]|uniref:Sau3AI family type II restriction endonuclease n=1 Tax=Clostridium perfringens TaxID=1502 RepID=UPI001A2869C4|nr:Sau3AI family type II restriction endonuclease [Clostridium perfringens]EJT6665432.1 restriction endonuclease [Clostridium perfringens]MDM0942330.1 Sau3AI family type II restriction endonuclease [Clostridium perfringens]MDU5491110.1 Sau3AI family type II restriction endonuclease [Clostridium perfringens]WPQ46789.1 Sau3AI family type II restriction endonuclease [Clostridium perfringens]HAT4068452.1 restriction endonuclease [Clostridium perfringens]